MGKHNHVYMIPWISWNTLFYQNSTFPRIGCTWELVKWFLITPPILICFEPIIMLYIHTKLRQVLNHNTVKIHWTRKQWTSPPHAFVNIMVTLRDYTLRVGNSITMTTCYHCYNIVHCKSVKSIAKANSNCKVGRILHSNIDVILYLVRKCIYNSQRGKWKIMSMSILRRL